MCVLRATSDKAASVAVLAVATLIAALPATAQESPPAANAQTAAVPAPKSAAKKPAQTPKSLTAWRGKVITHLNSSKSASAAADGTTTVAFKIDRSGKVLSSQVVASSGNKALDAEAVALMQRASPVPAPPADITGDTLFLKVPIRFKH